jgi:hypothetical protein
MDGKWSLLETTAPARWKLGLYVWREDGAWRLRLFRPWKHERLIEVQCEKFLLALYLLGIAAGWWKDEVFKDA